MLRDVVPGFLDFRYAILFSVACNQQSSDKHTNQNHCNYFEISFFITSS